MSDHHATSTAPSSEVQPGGTQSTPAAEVADATGEDPFDVQRMRSTSPWTLKQKFGRMLWYIVQGTIFRASPRPFYGFRRQLLSLFGAKIHPTARIRSTVKIEVPWNLSIGAYSSVGDHAILYCLGPVMVGERVTISQYAHLCAGTHDHTRPEMPLLTPPITIEDDVWIAADAFIGPNVRVGQGALVGARATVLRNVAPWKIVSGNPATVIRERYLRGSHEPGDE